MSNVCPQCNSSQYYTNTKRLCIKCRGKEIETKHKERNRGKAPSITFDFLFDHYYFQKKSLRELAATNNTTAPNIRYWLVKYEIPIRSRKEVNGNIVDSDFFKKLNPKSTYLLGYLFSDGDLLLNKMSSKYFLRLYSKYRVNIENVQNLLNTDAKIQYRKESTYGNRRQGALYFIHIADERLVEDLMDLGLVYDKNQTIKYPRIPEKLNPHFIRGLWAGSGSVYLTKEGYIRSQFNAGSLDLITEAERVLRIAGLKHRKIYQSKHTIKPAYHFRYCIEDTSKLYDYLYQDFLRETVEVRQLTLLRTYFG